MDTSKTRPLFLSRIVAALALAGMSMSFRHAPTQAKASRTKSFGSPERKYHRSCYVPHQGPRECARRRRQLFRDIFLT